MPLVTTTEMFKKAYEGGYARSFQRHNMEIVRDHGSAKVNAPLIAGVVRRQEICKHTYLKLVEAAIEEQASDLPAHDHGDSFELQIMHRRRFHFCHDRRFASSFRREHKAYKAGR